MKKKQQLQTLALVALQLCEPFSALSIEQLNYGIS